MDSREISRFLIPMIYSTTISLTIWWTLRSASAKYKCLIFGIIIKPHKIDSTASFPAAPTQLSTAWCASGSKVLWHHLSTTWTQCRTLRWWCCSVCGCCQTHAVGFCAVISKMADFNFRERVALMTCRVTPFTGQSVACILLTSHFWINSARLEPCTNKVAGTRYYKLLENPENWVGTSRYQWERVISVL